MHVGATLVAVLKVVDIHLAIPILITTDSCVVAAAPSLSPGH